MMKNVDWFLVALVVAYVGLVGTFCELKYTGYFKDKSPPMPHAKAEERRVVGWAVVEPNPVEFSDTYMMCEPALVPEMKLREAESCETNGGHVMIGYEFIECWSSAAEDSHALWMYEATREGVRFKVY